MGRERKSLCGREVGWESSGAMGKVPAGEEVSQSRDGPEARGLLFFVDKCMSRTATGKCLLGKEIGRNRACCRHCVCKWERRDVGWREWRYIRSVEEMESV
jgi:hypothetical protein